VTSTVSIQVDDAVALVVVDNPPVNALSNATVDELAGTAERLGGERDLRAVVLTGAGNRAFLSGADLREFAAALGERAWIEDHTLRTRRALMAWERLPQPVIAAVAAGAFGGGLEVALVCDLIVADERARFGAPEIRLGLMPGAGGTVRLPRRVGLGRAKELLMLGESIDAAEAHRLGLVNRIAPAGAAREIALELARALASLPAVAMRAIKRSLQPPQELDGALDRERGLFIDVFASADAGEGVRAFVEKRAPNYAHR
jgi:enoyl-CoA hydratase/carnithine racemase